MKKNTDNEPGAFVAFRSDWSKRWPNQDAVRNLDENDVQHTPGWSKEALEFLIHERHVKAVGHETLDTDSGVHAAAHGLINEYYLLSQDIFQVEVLANLDQVPAVGAVIQFHTLTGTILQGHLFAPLRIYQKLNKRKEENRCQIMKL